MIQGFFFDLDGTLVNTYQADFLAYRDALQEVVGVDIDEVEFSKTHGLEMRDKLKLLVPHTSESTALQIAAAKKKYYQQYVSITVPNTDLINLIANFTQHYAIVLVTTAKKDNALSVLREHDLEKYFSHMVFGDEITHPKPHPEPYYLALERSGLKAEEVIAFEDTKTGVNSAEAAGIPVVYVRTFHT
jgi:beta-phosphoglucomutase